MAFVREKITTEEDKALFNSFNFIEPMYKIPTTPRKWIIDRERNAFLTSIGGVEIPTCYAFVWNNNVILFSLFEKLNYLNSSKTEAEWSWNVLKFLAPKCLAEYEKEIIDMIKEAFIISKQPLGSVQEKRSTKYIFKFKKQPEYVLEGDDYKTRDVLREA